MALETPCQTPGAQYITHIDRDTISVRVELPVALFLTDEDAEVLEKNIHNALELALAPHFIASRSVVRVLDRCHGCNGTPCPGICPFGWPA